MISGQVSLESITRTWTTPVPQLQSSSQREKSWSTEQLWKPSFSQTVTDGTFLIPLYWTRDHGSDLQTCPRLTAANKA